ncbi:lipoprotein BA_5634 family protein [Paenibacillus alvei]|uniref:Lipoprotein BA_5634 family protein n=1 Tax=Paenibacillus alvei TaxID=44250 RepID=A0ABT4GZ12_PAEAL|nr:lipoprotein BA_5634 family protein [Paenibacillus alvei]MCY9761957.1 lipoprotein BA_5634 family protein [Paenibacillus alvei]MCY9768533.1 lipoprotein BA_5634 family protein [Paenibacillus alvei]
MKKIIGLVLVIAIFAGIGLGVKRFVEGPSQSVNGILVIGTDQETKKVKELYKDRSKEMIDYKMKLVTTKIVTKLSEQDKKETGQEVDIRNINYSVIQRSTAEQFIKKGIIRARQDPESLSIISDPVTAIQELSNGQNLLFSLGDDEMKNNQIDLNGKMVPVQYVKRQAWIGYRPMDLVIVDDKTYNNLKEAESTISLIHFQKESFDYKKKEKVNKVIDEIRSVYAVSEEKVNFVDVQD